MCPSPSFPSHSSSWPPGSAPSRRSTDLKNSGGDAFSEAELQASSAEGTDGSLTVGGVPVPGSFKAFTGQAGGDGQDGVTFSLFVPDGWKAGG